MKKSELESGMWVKTREGKEYLVIKNSKWEALVNEGGWNRLSDYSEDMVMIPDYEDEACSIFDIMQVFISHPGDCYAHWVYGQLIWERD